MNTTDTLNEAETEGLIKRSTRILWRCEAALERIQRWAKSIMESAEKTGTGIARTDTDCTDNSVRGSDSAQVHSNKIDIKVDANALAIIALIVATAAIVVVLMLPQIMDAKIQAGIAKAEETSRLASSNARIALEKQEQWLTRVAVLEDRTNRKEIP